MNKPLFTPEELARLGLPQASSGPATSVVTDVQTVSQGLDGSVDLLQAVEHSADFLAVPQAGQLDGLKARLEVHASNHNIWRVLMGQPLRHQEGTPGLLCKPEEGCAYLDTQALPEMVALVGQDGRALGLRRAPDGQWSLGALLPTDQRQAQGPLAGLRAPLGQWAKQLGQRHPWLRQQLVDAQRADLWGQVVAVGQAARLWPTEHDYKEAAARWLKGQGQAPDAPPSHASLRWGHTLDPDQLWHLEQLALEQAQALTQQLGHLDQRQDKDAPTWRAAWLDLLVQREQLEGVATVLREAFAGDDLIEALHAMDAPGEALMESLTPGWPKGTHLAALDHALTVDPGCWWAEGALWEDDLG
jgi:hypothetical protein